MQPNVAQDAAAPAVRPASSPRINALRNGAGYAAAAVGGSYASAIICQNSELSLDAANWVVGALATVAGFAAGAVGAFARNVMHEEESLPAGQRSRPWVRAFWKTVGGGLG